MSANDHQHAPARGLDEPAVTTWLAAALPDLELPLRYALIGGGRSNLTYRVDDASGRQVVLRRPPFGELLRSAHDVEREYWILTRLGEAEGPVPETFALCTDLDVTGAPFYVMEHVAGLTVADVAGAERLEFAARANAGRSLSATLARIHAADVVSIGLGDLRRPEPLASRQLRRWQSQWVASKTRELDVIDVVADELAARMPAEREAVLVHGDYHLQNLILSAEGDVRAVVDWELATVGDPMADVGLMLAYWHELGDAAGRADALFRESITTIPGFPAAPDLTETYANASGRDVSDVGYWVAFAYWKIAVVAEGVYRRWLDGGAQGPDARSLPGAVARLARQAESTLS
jgi:aminoglycoside phosphotransferase (APT) family kinase protein